MDERCGKKSGLVPRQFRFDGLGDGSVMKRQIEGGQQRLYPLWRSG